MGKNKSGKSKKAKASIYKTAKVKAEDRKEDAAGDGQNEGAAAEAEIVLTELEKLLVREEHGATLKDPMGEGTGPVYSYRGEAALDWLKVRIGSKDDGTEFEWHSRDGKVAARYLDVLCPDWEAEEREFDLSANSKLGPRESDAVRAAAFAMADTAPDPHIQILQRMGLKTDNAGASARGVRSAFPGGRKMRNWMGLGAWSWDAERRRAFPPADRCRCVCPDLDSEEPLLPKQLCKSCRTKLEAQRTCINRCCKGLLESLDRAHRLLQSRTLCEVVCPSIYALDPDCDCFHVTHWALSQVVGSCQWLINKAVKAYDYHRALFLDPKLFPTRVAAADEGTRWQPEEKLDDYLCRLNSVAEAWEWAADLLSDVASLEKPSEGLAGLALPSRKNILWATLPLVSMRLWQIPSVLLKAHGAGIRWMWEREGHNDPAERPSFLPRATDADLVPVLVLIAEVVELVGRANDVTQRVASARGEAVKAGLALNFHRLGSIADFEGYQSFLREEKKWTDVTGKVLSVAEPWQDVLDHFRKGWRVELFSQAELREMAATAAKTKMALMVLLSSGQLELRELGEAMEAIRDAADGRCFFCDRRLKGPSPKCSECKVVVACSDECAADHQELHNLICDPCPSNMMWTFMSMELDTFLEGRATLPEELNSGFEVPVVPDAAEQQWDADVRDTFAMVSLAKASAGLLADNFDLRHKRAAAAASSGSRKDKRPGDWLRRLESAPLDRPDENFKPGDEGDDDDDYRPLEYAMTVRILGMLVADLASDPPLACLHEIPDRMRGRVAADPATSVLMQIVSGAVEPGPELESLVGGRRRSPDCKKCKAEKELGKLMKSEQGKRMRER